MSPFEDQNIKESSEQHEERNGTLERIGMLLSLEPAVGHACKTTFQDVSLGGYLLGAQYLIRGVGCIWAQCSLELQIA